MRLACRRLSRLRLTPLEARWPRPCAHREAALALVLVLVLVLLLLLLLVLLPSPLQPPLRSAPQRG